MTVNLGGSREVYSTDGVGNNKNLVASRPPASRFTTGQKAPFPNVTIEAGKSNSYQILQMEKRAGWDALIKSGVRIGWYNNHKLTWFEQTGIFQMYKEINSSCMSKFISNLIAHARENFPNNQHSNNSIGGRGEDTLPYVRLCRKFELFKYTTTSKQDCQCGGSAEFIRSKESFGTNTFSTLLSNF